MVDQINYHCLDLESGGGGSFRGARGVPGRGGRGPPARRLDSEVKSPQTITSHCHPGPNIV